MTPHNQTTGFALRLSTRHNFVFPRVSREIEKGFSVEKTRKVDKDREEFLLTLVKNLTPIQQSDLVVHILVKN